MSTRPLRTTRQRRRRRPDRLPPPHRRRSTSAAQRSWSGRAPRTRAAPPPAGGPTASPPPVPSPRTEPATARRSAARVRSRWTRPPGTARGRRSADARQVDQETVVIRVAVGTDGRVDRVDVLQDPGFGFGTAARQCALTTRFGAADRSAIRMRRASRRPFGFTSFDEARADHLPALRVGGARRSRDARRLPPAHRQHRRLSRHPRSSRGAGARGTGVPRSIAGAALAGGAGAPLRRRSSTVAVQVRVESTISPSCLQGIAGNPEEDRAPVREVINVVDSTELPATSGALRCEWYGRRRFVDR